MNEPKEIKHDHNWVIDPNVNCCLKCGNELVEKKDIIATIAIFTKNNQFIENKWHVECLLAINFECSEKMTEAELQALILKGKLEK